MKRILALLLTLVMCFSIVACGKNKNNEEENAQPSEVDSIKNQLVGDWYDVGVNKGKISFNANGKGNMDYDASKLDFTWSYDTTEESLYIKISNKTFYIDLVTENGLTYVSTSGTWFFKEADMASGKAAVLAQRREAIAKALEGKSIISAGQDITVNDKLGVKVESIDNKNGDISIEMTLKNNSDSSVSIQNIRELIHIGKTKFYTSNSFATIDVDKLGTTPTVADNLTELAAGADVKISFTLFTSSGFENITEHWGELNAYRSIIFGNNEYYIDLGAHF